MTCQEEGTKVIRKPDRDIDPVWDKMSEIERSWYRDFVRGTKYGDLKALERVFHNVDPEVTKRIMTELYYEWKARERQTYRIPKAYNSTYTEWSYCWEQPVRNPNKRSQIDKMHDPEVTGRNTRWAR